MMSREQQEKPFGASWGHSTDSVFPRMKTLAPIKADFMGYFRRSASSGDVSYVFFFFFGVGRIVVYSARFRFQKRNVSLGVISAIVICFA